MDLARTRDFGTIPRSFREMRNAMQPDNNTGRKLEEISARQWTRSRDPVLPANVVFHSPCSFNFSISFDLRLSTLRIVTTSIDIQTLNVETVIIL